MIVCHGDDENFKKGLYNFLWDKKKALKALIQGMKEIFKPFFYTRQSWINI